MESLAREYFRENIQNILTFGKECISIINKPAVLWKGGTLEALEERYEVIRLIASTEHSKVYLVRHRQLEVYRVAKIVSGGSADCERALKEANIIKDFKHSGIPLVYDIEVSGDSICIIEEYIAGKSLVEYIAKERLTPEQIASIGVNICEVLEYLHDCVGIVHMDIKPANIIVRDKSVKKHGFTWKSSKNNYDICIIDFDSSGYTHETLSESFGSVGYAAPEQYLSQVQSPSVQMDVYSMGMLLLYMLGGGHIQSFAESADKLCELHSDTIGPIIRRCIRHSRIRRFKSIKELKEALLAVAYGKTDKRKQNNTRVVRDICVYGTRHGVGTTHFCLCLAAFLHRYYKHSKVLYKRCNDRYDVFGEACKGKLGEQGAYERHGIYIMPDYGGGISCDESWYDIVVRDYGIERPKFEEESTEVICICVDVRGYRNNVISATPKCGGMMTSEAVAFGDVTFVNHISGKRFYELVKQAEGVKRYYRMPCVYEWNETNKIFEEAVIEALEIKRPKKT